MSNQIVSFPDREQLINEAAAWIAKLDAGHLSATDLSALRAWAGTSKQHRNTLEHVASEWDELAFLALSRALVSDDKQDVLGNTGPQQMAWFCEGRCSSWRHRGVWRTGLVFSADDG